MANKPLFISPTVRRALRQAYGFIEACRDGEPLAYNDYERMLAALDRVLGRPERECPACRDGEPHA